MAAFLAVFAILCVASVARKSITTDEIPHITSGYTYWKTGDFRINPEHPPLAKMAAGLPLIFVDPAFNTTDPGWKETWEQALQDQGFGFAFRFLTEVPENLQNHRTILFWARMPIVLFGLLLCLWVYLLARLLYGGRAAWISLTLCAFSPIVIAHSRLVTTDLAVTTFWVGATYHMIRHLRKPSWMQLSLAGVATGLAMASKFSGVFALLVTGFVCLLSVFMRGGPWSATDQRPVTGDLVPRLLRWSGQMTIYTGIALAVVFLTYFGHEIGRYFEGFDRVWGNHDPRYRAFFLGGHYAGIIWSYYVVALAIKMPLGTIALATIGGLSAVAALWRKRDGESLSWPERLLLILPAAFIFAISTLSGKYLGVRYVLPCLPLLFLLGGRVMTMRLFRGAGRWLPIALAASVAVSSLLAFPEYIAYFNEAAGGKRGGARLLDDSNIDWGQDWVQAAAYQQAHNLDDLHFAVWNRIDPRPLYGLKGTQTPETDTYLPREGWYMVSAHTLNRDYIYSYDRPTVYDWLERYEPVALVGGATYVFRFWIERPGHPVPEGFRGTVLTPERRYADAADRLRIALERRPESVGVPHQQARLHIAYGHKDEARRAVDATLGAALAAAETALRNVSKINVSALSRMDRKQQFRYMSTHIHDILRFPEVFSEVMSRPADPRDGAPATAGVVVVAGQLGDPDLVIRCLETALEIVRRFTRIPRGFMGYWRDLHEDERRTVQALAAARRARAERKNN